MWFNTTTVLIVVVLLGATWAFFEKRVQLFRAGFYMPSLGYEKTGLLLAIGQGTVTLAIFGICIAAFFIRGWKLGLSALFLSLVTATILTSNKKK